MVGCHDYCCYLTSCDYVEGVVVGGGTKCPDKWVPKIPINECPDKRGFTVQKVKTNAKLILIHFGRGCNKSLGEKWFMLKLF